MPNIAGRLQSATIDGVPIGSITDGNLNPENAELDTTSHDDQTSRTFIYGRQSATAEFTMRWDDANAGQEDILDAAFGKTINTYVFLMETLSGSERFTFQGLATATPLSAPNDDVAEFSATIRVTGDITRDTQP
jgi:hypothetical protein